MYELYPYFTNDGTVGLFSQSDDDIYHSTYGALTESWQKFVLPSHLKEFIAKNESVKILDICYGIGYNTKTALNVFIENFLQNEKKIEKKKNNLKISQKNIKNYQQSTLNNAAIYTDNIQDEIKNDLEENINKNNENCDDISTVNTISSAAIDADNISSDNCRNILIDAVDMDEVLIELSPFIRINPKRNSLISKGKSKLESVSGRNKFAQVKKMQSNKMLPIKKELRLKKEVPMILLKKLMEKHPKFSEDLKSILSNKSHKEFLSKYMLNFATFIQNKGSNHTKEKNKTPFLHNIYYQYVSKSYKNARKVLQNAKIDVNLNKNDARAFIKSSDTVYNFIFLDAFTPSKCPALWSVEFFKELYSRLDDNGMILTYSNSAAIRNAFIENGFSVGKSYDRDLQKFVGTVAVKNNNLIEFKLTEYDLGLINSKAGICYRDENLNLENSEIIKNRELEVSQSDLLSSSQYLKGYRNVKPL